MKTPLRDRFAFWVGRLPYLRWLVLRYDGAAPNGMDRYRNIVNGHNVTVNPGGPL